MTDNEIIRGIRENSEQAWRELTRQTYAVIRPGISDLLRHNAVLSYDDIYTQACVDLMENVKTGKLLEHEDVNLSGYLYVICRNKALTAERKRISESLKQQKMQADQMGPEASERYAPDVILEYDPDTEQSAEDELLAFLEKVLASIPESCRKLFRRFYWDKMSMDDIASVLGLRNSDVAKTTKNRCMNKFKSIAKSLLQDDEKVEAALQRTVERDALRDLLKACCKEADGEWAMAALTTKSETTKKEE